MKGEETGTKLKVSFMKKLSKGNKIIIGIGICIFIYGGVNRYLIDYHGIRAEGRIIYIRTSKSIRVQYVNAEHQLCECIAPWQVARDFKMGKKINIKYNPYDGSKCRVVD